MLNSGIRDGRALTLPVLVTISSVSVTIGPMLRSRATSDASIVMLDPVSSQKLKTLPPILTGTNGVPTADIVIGSDIDCDRKVKTFAGTFLKAVAQSSMLARSVLSILDAVGSFRRAANAAHFSLY